LDRATKWARRRPGIAASAVGVLVFAVVGLAVSNTLIRREMRGKEIALREKGEALSKAQANFEQAQEQEKLAEEQRGIAQANEKTAKAQTSLANRRLYASQMNLAMQAWRAGEVPRVLELLEAQRPGSKDEDLRGFEWYYLWRLCRGGRRV